MFASLLLSGIGGDLNAQISQAAYDMTRPVIVLLMASVVPVMMTITLVTTIARGYLSGQSLQIDLAPIFKILLIAAFLLSYRTLVPYVGDTVYYITKAVAGNGAQAQAYSTLENLKPKTNGVPADPAPKTVANGEQDQPSLISSLAGKISEFTSSITAFSLQTWLLGLATGAIAQLIQMCMLFIQAFLLGFLFVVGPISFVLSMLPGFGGLMKSWFQSFFSVHLWTLSFAVLNKLFLLYTSAIATQMSTMLNNPASSFFASATSNTQYQVGCLIFIIMYLMIPYMTSLVVGSSGAQAFVGAAAGMVASRAAMGMGKSLSSAASKGGTSAASGGGSGGDSAPSPFGAGGFSSASTAGHGSGGGGGGSSAMVPMMAGVGAGSPAARSANSTATPIYSRAALGAAPASTGGSSGSWGAAAPANPGAPNRMVNLGSNSTLRGTVGGTGEVGSGGGGGSSAAARLGSGQAALPPASDAGTGATDVSARAGRDLSLPPSMPTPGMGGGGGSF